MTKQKDREKENETAMTHKGNSLLDLFTRRYTNTLEDKDKDKGKKQNASSLSRRDIDLIEPCNSKRTTFDSSLVNRFFFLSLCYVFSFALSKYLHNSYISSSYYSHTHTEVFQKRLTTMTTTKKKKKKKKKKNDDNGNDEEEEEEEEEDDDNDDNDDDNDDDE
ncbi:hypothetical protein RFI_29352 [Reticulomyxa filosa]|uniref:Uncharacterized protein n=1 Tax=Reticulomyxa filosa TaxID=46433 RepID=X6M1K8_RETFI|nr:hypothetical protein RFI_29352 [Reticulomyxa filosa]|eukprot:ETO08038.1 hypothetical protein RFI_29352 [Reticulomyxa filosa]